MRIDEGERSKVFLNGGNLFFRLPYTLSTKVACMLFHMIISQENQCFAAKKG
jgi:hypothetical protein